MKAQNWYSWLEATAVVGSLGFPSKMPGTSYGIPAAHCKVGALLRKLKGTTCADCYAFKGQYPAPSVVKGQAIRFASLTDPRWAFAMASALLLAHGMIAHKGRGKRKGKRRVHRKIKPGGVGWHRWHDAGDLQSMAHLLQIVEVCRLTPRIRHWLPTREASLIAQYEREHGAFPPNLCVRVSATKIDGAPSARFPNTSTVHARESARGHACPAPTQGGVCGSCRACWSLEVANTSYHVH
jgi:hypothetical protein